MSWEEHLSSPNFTQAQGVSARRQDLRERSVQAEILPPSPAMKSSSTTCSSSRARLPSTSSPSVSFVIEASRSTSTTCGFAFPRESSFPPTSPAGSTSSALADPSHLQAVHHFRRHLQLQRSILPQRSPSTRLSIMPQNWRYSFSSASPPSSLGWAPSQSGTQTPAPSYRAARSTLSAALQEPAPLPTVFHMIQISRGASSSTLTSEEVLKLLVVVRSNNPSYRYLQPHLRHRPSRSPPPSLSVSVLHEPQNRHILTFSAFPHSAWAESPSRPSTTNRSSPPALPP